MNYDVVRLGPHAIACGGCLEVMDDIEDHSVDLILADLPYGTTSCKWDAVIPIEPLWTQYRRILKPKGAVVLTASQPFTSILVASNLPWFKCEWIWEKNAGSNFGSVKWQPMKEHESVLVFAPGTCTYNPIMEDRAPSGLARTKYKQNYNTKTEVYLGGLHNAVTTNTEDGKRPSQRYPRSIQKFNRERGLHPTQKPEGLMSYLVRTYSNPGDLVLDNTMGSGTTGVAAIKDGRLFKGIESDPAYFEVARKRLAGILGDETPLAA